MTNGEFIKAAAKLPHINTRSRFILDIDTDRFIYDTGSDPMPLQHWIVLIGGHVRLDLTRLGRPNPPAEFIEAVNQAIMSYAHDICKKSTSS